MSISIFNALKSDFGETQDCENVTLVILTRANLSLTKT